MILPAIQPAPVATEVSHETRTQEGEKYFHGDRQTKRQNALCRVPALARWHALQTTTAKYHPCSGSVGPHQWDSSDRDVATATSRIDAARPSSRNADDHIGPSRQVF